MPSGGRCSRPADNSGLKIGVKGEKEFKKALADINQSFRILGPEMRPVSTQFDKNDKSVQALSARNNVLNREIETQEQQNRNLELFIQKVGQYARHDRIDRT